MVGIIDQDFGEKEQNIGKVFGYGRVSTREQNPARQRDILKDRCDVYYEDKLSGANMDRPEFRKMLEQLRSGDTVMVLSIDRIGRNLRELINLFSDFQERGINIIAVNQGIDTSTRVGQMFFAFMAIFAQAELEFIKERQREGIEIAKKEGKYRGRPLKKLDDWEQLTKAVDDGLITVGKACKLMKIGRSTYYRRKERMADNTQSGIGTGKLNDDEYIDF